MAGLRCSEYGLLLCLDSVQVKVFLEEMAPGEQGRGQAESITEEAGNDVVVSGVEG